ncbi:MAG: hypothetical protein WC799_00570 [Desulfobacteraceae bacterium]|jgi:hypothetical protein
MPEKNSSVAHPLIGTWITDNEDSDAAFSITFEDGAFKVHGFCRSDGEEFEISNLEWNGEWLRFTAKMLSTDTISKNAFRIRPDGRANLELTIFEVWKKKAININEPPQTWKNF